MDDVVSGDREESWNQPPFRTSERRPPRSAAHFTVGRLSCWKLECTVYADRRLGSRKFERVFEALTLISA